MKQRIFDLLFIVVLIADIILGLFYINNNSISMYQSRKDVQITQVNEYLYMEEDCSKEEVEEIQTLLKILPPSLFEDFRAENGKIILVSNLEDDCVGSTEVSKKGITIYIEDGYVFDTLMHEFGHVYLHFHPMEEDFKELYETEAKSLVDAYYGDNNPYYYSNEVEYFAQAFQTVLCMGGHDTQEAAPKTFSYMTDLITELFNQDK